MSKQRDWLMTEIANGLQLIIALALPGQPPADTIKLTAATWRRAFAARSREWDFDQDAQRIRDGFDSLLPELDSWPQPRQLLAAMPPRPKPLELPPAKQTEEHRKVAKEWLPVIKKQIEALDEARRKRYKGQRQPKATDLNLQRDEQETDDGNATAV